MAIPARRTTMTTCSEVRPLLIELVFGELDNAQEMRVNQHLLACPACGEEEARLLALKDSARRVTRVVSPTLRARIEGALPPLPPRAPGGLRRPVPAYVAVAAALLGALVMAALPLRLAPPAPSERGVRAVPGPAPPRRAAPFPGPASSDHPVPARPV